VLGNCSPAPEKQPPNAETQVKRKMLFYYQFLNEIVMAQSKYTAQQFNLDFLAGIIFSVDFNSACI
jgi:hypothetical protein